MKKGYHKGQELTMSELGLSLEEHAVASCPGSRGPMPQHPPFDTLPKSFSPAAEKDLTPSYFPTDHPPCLHLI